MIFHEQETCVWLGHLLPMGWSLAFLWRLEGWKAPEQPSRALFLPFKMHHPQVRSSFLTKYQSGVVPSLTLLLQPLGMIIVPAWL